MFSKSNNQKTKLIKFTAAYMAWPKLGNAAPPTRNHLSGALKFFPWMVMQKSEPRRGDAKLGGSGGMPPQKILRSLTLFWRLFVRFEPLKFLSFNKV